MDWKIAKWPVITKAAQGTKAAGREKKKPVVASSVTTPKASSESSNTSRPLRNVLPSVGSRDDLLPSATTPSDPSMKNDPTSATPAPEPWKDLPGRCGYFYFEDLSLYDNFFKAAIPSMTSILLARSELRHIRDRERSDFAIFEDLTVDRVFILDDLANQVRREINRLMSADMAAMAHERSGVDGLGEAAVDSEGQSEFEE